jgi:serine phosphatase RsbU (regulator of sigma subunit)
MATVGPAQALGTTAPATSPAEPEALLLVVDDDPDILRVVKFYLTKQRYQVFTAENGREAIAILERTPIELILSDVMMPEVNGMELLRYVRASPMLRDIPVVLISAEGEAAKRVAGLNLGADDFISKPFNFDELIARVHNHLRLRRLQHEVLLANEALRQQNERLKEDLEAARATQMALLPDSLPESEHYALGSRYLPVDRVGGDFFDAVVLEHGRKLGVIVSDVCGHGISAAFITAMTKITFRDACFRSSDPARVLELMNRSLSTTLKNGFVTAFYGVYDTVDHTLTYASGGHPPLLVQRRTERRIFELEPQATFLGFFQGVKFTSDAVVVQRGDRILFYTDGLYESQDDKAEAFGMARIKQVIQDHADKELPPLFDALLDQLRAHAGRIQPADDITMVGLDIL